MSSYKLQTLIQISQLLINTFIEIKKTSMSFRLRFKELETLKVNITSSLDINKQQTRFVIFTRQRSKQSAQFIHRLQLYQLQSLKHIKSVKVYQSYQEKRYPVKFLIDGRIAVATKYHLIIYNQNFQVQYKVLHQQINLYDLCVSPDNRYIAIVGQQSAFFWDIRTYQVIPFQNIVTTARKCDFSNDGLSFAISDNTLVTVYDLTTRSGYLQFQNPRFTQVVEKYGLISQIQFNPYDSNQIVVGFSNISPRIYRFNSTIVSEEVQNNYIKINNSTEQPFFYDNFKQVTYLPDGKRVLSSDYKKGVGLWPGDSSRQLYYKQNFLLFGLRPFKGGSKFIGYVWERVKIVQIQMQCGRDAPFTKACKCQQNQYFDTSTYTCKRCPVRNCQCGGNFNFSSNIGACVLDCDGIQNTAINSPQSTSKCLCRSGYIWQNNSCILNCQQIRFATIRDNDSCQCLQGFVWSKEKGLCQCPPDRNFDRLSQTCNCANGLQLDPNTQRCIANCDLIANSLPRSQNNDKQCICEQDYVYAVQQDISTGQKSYACRFDCSTIKNAYKEQRFDGTCQCTEKFDWVQTSEVRQCEVNCTKIQNSVPGQRNDGSCPCSLNYQWQPQIYQCARQCDNTEYVDRQRNPTAYQCPCIKNFQWDPQNQLCKLDCLDLDFAVSYAPNSNLTCLCRDYFYWQKKDYQCVLNCSQIWDAQQRKQDKPGQCTCKNDKIFNPKKLTCDKKQDESENEGLGSFPFWIWIILGFAVLFVLIVTIIMVRYCWKFSTEKKNKQHNKKLKKTMDPPRRRKIKKNNKKEGTSTERMSLNRG